MVGARTSRIRFPASPGCGIIPRTRPNPQLIACKGGFVERTNCSSRTGMELHGAPRRIPDLCVARRKPPGIHRSRGHSWRALRAAVWRRDGIRWFTRGPHRFGFHPHFGAVHQHSSQTGRLSAAFRAANDPREQHCPDHGLGRRIARGRRDVYDSSFDLPGFRLGIHLLAHLSAGPSWRVARCVVHGAAAAPVDRQGTRKPGVSRRHGLRRRAGRRRARGFVRGARLLGTRSRWRLHLPYENGPCLD